jgi:hypothetical protein
VVYGSSYVLKWRTKLSFQDEPRGIEPKHHNEMEMPERMICSLFDIHAWMSNAHWCLSPAIYTLSIQYNPNNAMCHISVELPLYLIKAPLD